MSLNNTLHTMRAYKDNISKWGDPNFVPSSSTIGDLARVRALFVREGVPWITPISAHDESMLRHIGYKIDVYLASKVYVADHSDNRELLAISAIMKKASKGSGPRGPARLHWALCRNAQAFADHANQRYAAAMEAEAASELEREREEALDELALRDANEFAASVQDVLNRMDFDDEVDEVEFADAFASDDEADEEEGELEAEGEEEREEEVGEEVDEEVKK